MIFEMFSKFNLIDWGTFAIWLAIFWKGFVWSFKPLYITIKNFKYKQEKTQVVK